MVNTNDKGNRAQNEVRIHLEAEGYAVHVARRTTYMRNGKWFSVGNDLFGCFDVIAVHPILTHVLFIQVTDGGGASKKRKQVEAVFPRKAWIKDFQVWERRGREGGRTTWRIHRVSAVTGEWDHYDIIGKE